MSRPRVGVLALQGDVREHLALLGLAGAEPVAVRRADQLDGVEGIVLPGGESTVIARLLRTVGLWDPLRERLRGGMPAFGTCAGMILLADHLEDGTPGQRTLGGLDVVVRRNAFGRQVRSFETALALTGLDEPFHATFIRAPWVEKTGAGVEVLGRVAPEDPGDPEGPGAGSDDTGAEPVPGPAVGRVVAVRQDGLMATSFHPEIAGDVRLHAQFVATVRARS